MSLFRAFAIALSPIIGHSAPMLCGSGVPLCGTLTLQSGLGSGCYHSANPAVHGLWPETRTYGTSQCIRPQVSEGPSKIYSCYADANDTDDHILWFENHEWTKHGQCAGSEPPLLRKRTWEVILITIPSRNIPKRTSLLRN